MLHVVVCCVVLFVVMWAFVCLLLASCAYLLLVLICFIGAVCFVLGDACLLVCLLFGFWWV